jgi:hypothetical protein
MDHESAGQTLATERYFLREMTSEERDGFEGHYFSCAECANDVYTTFVFLENVKVALSRSDKSPARDWLAWLRPLTAVPVFAALALAVTVGYQNSVTIPALRAPQSMASAVILDGATRAPSPQIHVGEPLRFQMALDDSGAGARVTVELADASSKVLRRGSIEAPGLNQPLDVYFPGRLNPGRYTIVVRADHADRPGAELARRRLEIVPQGEQIQ